MDNFGVNGGVHIGEPRLNISFKFKLFVFAPFSLVAQT